MNGLSQQDQIVICHQQDLLRAAEPSQRARALLPNDEKLGVHARILTRMGKTLSKVGDTLQEHYNTLPESPVHSEDRRLKTA